MMKCQEMREDRVDSYRFIPHDADYNSRRSSSSDKVKAAPEDPEAKFMTDGA